MKFYPAILSDSLEEIAHQLTIAQSLDNVSVVQIDILDGLFADNLTISPSDLTQLDFGNLKIDFHFMVDEPMDYVHEMADYLDVLPVRVVLAQVEKLSFQQELIQELNKHKIKPGLSLDLFTPLEAIKQDVYGQLSYIQLMAIEAGFQGQQLNECVYQKIYSLKKLINEHKLNLEVIVDGGVNLDNIHNLKKAGVDAVAIGSMLWSAEDPQVIAKEVSRI